MALAAEEFLAGQVLLIDKPVNWTSFDVVNKIRYSLKKYCGVKKIKVGHAGTLDPLATGLLIVCTGKFTKKIDEFQGMPKAYRAKIKFGEETPSFDAETEVSKSYPTDSITIEEVEECVHSFIGKIEQVPPIYSAIKKEGRKLYELAREGEEVKIKARQVEITKFDLVENNWPEITADIECSKGTYIRSLAHDLGKKLNNGAHLSGLVRTSIGQYQVSDAQSVSEFLEALQA